jgi:hypothetical protein
MVQQRVADLHESTWLRKGGGVAQIVVRRQARVRFSARHPYYGNPSSEQQQ